MGFTWTGFGGTLGHVTYFRNFAIPASVVARCLVPDFDGAIFSPEWKEALWDKFYTAAPQQRTPRDNGIQFTFPPRDKDGPTATYITHMFDMRCRENRIEHRLTKIRHPWTNGQVERMNRTIKDATVKRYHYDDHGQLRDHFNDFINAYSYARRLKTLSGLTPYEYICKTWTNEPERFKLNPIHQMPGLNT